jgi:endonuclease YncB( thermonuclease family)
MKFWRNYVMSFKCNIIFIALLMTLLYTGRLHAEIFKGKIADVLDGDTIEVLHNGKPEAVRLAQIYAPVKGQPYAITARNYILKVATDKMVTVRFEDYDLYARPLGEVFLADGTNLNKMIVAAGYAWRYEGYSKDPEYAVLEAHAKAARLGLWQAPGPVPPWEWQWMVNKASGTSASGGQASEKSFNCGSKQYCHEMNSCEEAKFYLYACGLERLDRDQNGIPCENLCK